MNSDVEIERPAEPVASGPTILLIATTPWISSTRLAKSLRLCGFVVEAVCHVAHPLRLLDRPIQTHRLGWILEERSIRLAVAKSKPSLIVPCDDAAVAILHRLHRAAGDREFSALIEASLGNPANFAAAGNRSELIALAHSMGLRAPLSQPVGGLDNLMRLAKSHAFPCVLKRDHTWAGFGVKIVERAQDIRAAWSWIAGPFSLLRSGISGLRHKRPRAFVDFCKDRSAAIELQEYIPGRPANRAVVCRDGRVLAGISVEALQTSYPNGPASVVRVVDNPEMTATVEALVGRLGLSGFCGFDFIMAETGRAYLLELNPRATPVCHLAVSDATDLPAALYRAVTGKEPAALAPPVPGEIVALFPNELERDPSSAMLLEAYHDAPWDEPRLLEKAGLRGSVCGPRRNENHRPSDTAKDSRNFLGPV